MDSLTQGVIRETLPHAMAKKKLLGLIGNFSGVIKIINSKMSLIKLIIIKIEDIPLLKNVVHFVYK